MPQADNSPAVVAVFDDREAAEKAVLTLEREGFSHEDVGFVLRDEEAARTGTIVDGPARDTRSALNGAITGGMVGGVVAAAASILIPGVGPIIAGGVLAAFFGGTIAGTAVGGILGALRGLGVSEEKARVYEEHFHAGRAVVVVKPGERSSTAESILRRFGAFDVHTEPQAPIQTGGPHGTYDAT
jgi:hypothetical protein